MTLANRTEKVRVTSHMMGGSKRSWRRLLHLMRAFKAGADVKEAAAVSDLSEDAVGAWLRDGHSGKQPEQRIAACIDRLTARYDLSNLSHVSKSGARDWKAAAFLLQNGPRTRDRYGARVETDADTATATVMAALAASLAARAQVVSVEEPEPPRLSAPGDAE